MKPMTQKISMVDIARGLGVSRATVSYVLSDPDTEMVGDVMRARVLAAAREMGYRPNRAAQTLAGRPSNLIELFVGSYHSPFYARVLHEFQQQVRPTQYQLHVVDPSHWREVDWEKSDSGWPRDGIIIVDTGLPHKAMESLRERSIPLVWIGTHPNTDFDHVRVDLSPALLEAFRYLAARKKRIAYSSPWSPEEMATYLDQRYPMYCTVMKEAAMPTEVITTPDGGGRDNRAVARQMTRDYIQRNGCPDAIFCFNDERAIATLAALRDLNYRVPEDVLIIGCDGNEDTAYHAPPLSTIAYPITEATHIAWQFLQHRIKHPNTPPQSATLTAQLVLRESSSR